MIGECLRLCGYSSVTYADCDQAAAFARELLGLAQHTELKWARDSHLEVEGMLARYRCDLPQARALLAECAGLRRSIGEELNAVRATLQLAWTELDDGNVTQAADHLRACIAYHRRAPFAMDLPHVLEADAALCAVTGRQDSAARLWGAAEWLRERFGAPRWPVDRADYERRVAACRAAMGGAPFDAAFAAGRA